MAAAASTATGWSRSKGADGSYSNKPGAAAQPYAKTAMEAPVYTDATKPDASVAPQDQFARILSLYPQVGVAGSAQNKVFVDAYKAGGSNMGGSLALAHSLFSGTQSQVMGGQTPGQKTAQDQSVANSRIIAKDAALTPQERQTQATKGQENQAKLDDLGRQEQERTSTYGGAVGVGAATYEGFTKWGDTLANETLAIPKGIYNFFAGTDPTAPKDPAAPAIAAPTPKPATDPASVTPLKLTQGTPAPAPAPVAVPTPAQSGPVAGAPASPARTIQATSRPSC